ncbi:hypothetical protein DC363_05080 [Thalassorhabdomicrobium marinisediminis]|uniref:Uncharacterized protein n=2 Tax=Thalassorhabdomicrobium marinisediminis TaxID=2170577 RepID=A0A2T7FYL4_9RHOB|nr:hypothetical protein DC363_05080 [Thalassorhabdomicrobium marinisediminis]
MKAAAILCAALLPGVALAECDMTGTTLVEVNAAQWINIANAVDLDPNDLRAATGTVRGVLTDLNRDGAPELCVDYDTTLTCSNGVAVCAHAILAGPHFERVLFHDAGHVLRVASSPAPTWAALSMESTYSNGEIALTILTYQNDAYHSAGQVVIGQR